MSHLSQREASRIWGVSRAKIQRDSASGKLSVSIDKLIDPAEMLRVYGEPRAGSEPAQSGSDEPIGPPTGPIAETVQKAVLEATILAKDREIELLKANLEDLRAQVRLLTHEAPAKKRNWWPFG